MSAQAVDVIVIGSGIAGLTAAALLAQAGKRVVVCERDVHPGGCAASYQHKGYRFAVGATVGMGFEPGGLHHQMCQRLGLTIDYQPLNPAIRVHLPDRVVPIATERSAWLQALPHHFPEEDATQLRAAWLEFARIARAMRHLSARFPVLPFRHPYDVLDTARGVHPQLWHLLRNLRATVAGVLQRYGLTSPAHRAFVDGQLLDAMQTDASDCVATAGALALDIYRYGCQYLHGGLSQLAEKLVASIEANGGTVMMATRVRAILTTQQGHRLQVRGVRTNRGEWHAPALISAVPLSNTAALLEQPALSRLPARADAQAEMWGAFTLYLGVDARCLPSDVHLFEQVTDIGHYHDGGNLLISISPAWDSSRAPAGKRAITVSTHVRAEPWMQLDRNSEAYRQAKATLETQMLDQMQRALPNLRQGIEHMQSGSPRTFYNFTLRAGGTVGGFPQTHAHAVFNAPSHRSDVAGLWLAGDTIFPGQGTLGTTVSGHNAARSALRYLARA